MRALALALLLGCTPEPGPSGGDSSAPPPDEDSLAALGLLSWDGQAFTYAEGVVPYTLGTPLFSDYAVKERAVALPPGEAASWAGDGVLDFPVGTRLVKSFLFPADLRAPDQDLRLVETRVLTREDDGWSAWPYLWNEEQTEARRAPAGDVVDVSFLGLDGQPVDFSYLVPQRNQCVDCHEHSVGGARENTPIGPKPRNLNHGGQLQAWIDAGLVTGVPPLDEVGAATDAATLQGLDPATQPDEVVFAAARDYLDVNCAHCHHPDAEEGRSSQLFLSWDTTDAFHLGVCKKPGSAGRGTGGLIYDIVPGVPERSILWYRLQTPEIGEMMPDIGRALVDERNVPWVAEWIARQERPEGQCSQEP
ncbi:MAG: hypothetical protein R3F59_30515 [Myxococcota bacterium]